MFEWICDVIDCNDFFVGFEYVLVDRNVKVELEGFVKVVFECFGECSLLLILVKDVNGEIFYKLMVGMNFL